MHKIIGTPQTLTPTNSSAPISSLNRRLLSGGAWAFAGKVITVIFGLMVNVLLARLLTPEEMGAYFLTFSLVSVAAMIAQLGLSQTVVRLVAESIGTGQPGRAAAAIRIVFRFGAIGSLLMAGFLALGIGAWIARVVFDSAIMAGVILLASLWVVVMTCQNLLAESFRGFHDIRLATIFGGLVTSVLSALLFGVLWVWQGRASLSQVIVLALVAGGTSALVAGVLLHRRVKPLQGQDSSTLQGKDVLRIAWPLLVTNLLLFALTGSDLWILGAFRSHEEVAIYGAAKRLVLLVSMSLFIVNAVVPPLIAEMYAQGKKRELERALRITATIAGIPAFGVVLVFILFSGPILGLVYGDFYRAGSTVLMLLSFGQLINVWAGSCGLTLIMTGHQATLMWVTALCGFVAVCGSLLLVQRYGPVGVAGAAAFAMVLQNVLMLLAARKRTGLWTHVKISVAVLKYDLLRMQH